MPLFTRESQFQIMPRSGRLFERRNPPLTTVRSEITGKPADVYCYIVDTVELGDDGYSQLGSAPNVQGDIVTLASCKHSMRASRSVEDWPGTWIVGLTGLDNVPDRRHYLIYLMLVGEAYKSQKDLWEALSEDVREAKAAHLHRHGDVYEPWSRLRDPWKALHYTRPRSDHVHCTDKTWEDDICYTKGVREAALLVGDPVHSFLWYVPQIICDLTIQRGHIVVGPSKFLTLLRQA